MQYSIFATLAAALMAVQALAVPAPDFGAALEKRQCWGDGTQCAYSEECCSGSCWYDRGSGSRTCGGTPCWNC
ncbi:hypothetical protein BST61_g3280 [Cercospora zeina]